MLPDLAPAQGYLEHGVLSARSACHAGEESHLHHLRNAILTERERAMVSSAACSRFALSRTAPSRAAGTQANAQRFSFAPMTSLLSLHLGASVGSARQAPVHERAAWLANPRRRQSPRADCRRA